MMAPITCLLALYAAIPLTCLGQEENRPPVFTRISNFSVAENTRIGTEVYHVRGSDFEEDTLTYSMQSDYFEIRDPRNGRIYVRSNIDFERIRSIPTVISLSDGFHTVRSSITIEITDMNDERPGFGASVYRADIREDENVGFYLPEQIIVRDRDTVNPVLEITCDSSQQFGESCNTFEVLEVLRQPNTEWRGWLRLKAKLDYEVQNFYRVPLRAYDGKHETRVIYEVTVLNVADAGPVFTSNLETTVDDNTPAGRDVIQVRATIPDASGGFSIIYEWARVPVVGNAFTIDRNTGMIRTAITMDRESSLWSDGFVTVEVWARRVNPDGSIGSDESSATKAEVRINIRDVNDNPPTISPPFSSVTIKEDIASGSQISNIFFVTDLDQGDFAKYEIYLENYQNVFEVVPNQGEKLTRLFINVRNTDLIDYDLGIRSYQLKIVARERFTRERYQTSANLTINIQDVPDAEPDFEQSEYRAQVQETAAGGTRVIQIRVRYPPNIQNMQATYSLTGNGNEKFRVNQFTGQVTVANCATPGSGSCIDYEQQQSYRLTFQAQDSQRPNFRITVPLTIDVIDVNDNTPEFYGFTGNGRYVGFILEGRRNPDPAIQVQARDADGNANIQFRIVAGNIQGLWRIDANGFISATEAVDFSKTPNGQGFYLLTIEASDGQFTKTAEVRITVVDTNDHGPVFNPTYYEQPVSERTVPGTVVETVTATDGDSAETGNGRIVYSIQSGADRKFVIDPNTGEIRLANGATLDFTQKSEYRIIVVATDQPQGSQTARRATATVVLKIRSRNQQCPYFQPSSIRIEVPENATVESIVGRMVAADAEGKQLEYSLVEPIRAWDRDGNEIDPRVLIYKDIFRIEPNTGYILVGRKIDQNRISRIQYTVQVRDISLNIKNCENGTINIIVTDVNDLPPYFIPPWTPERPEYTIEVNEELPFDAYVTTMVAADPDGRIMRYDKADDQGSHFRVHPNTGVVTIARAMDYERIQTTQFIVHAIDDGFPPQTATATVWVRIVNINDVNPVFNQSVYTAIIKEHSPRKTPVTTVRATDGDYDNFGQVRYTLNSERRFSIDNRTGVILVQDPTALDREVSDIISITVEAYDSYLPIHEPVRRRTTVPVYITLTDINDNKPIFNERIFYATLVESFPKGAFVIKLEATDADINANGEMYFTKSSGDETGLFAVDSTTGEVTVTRSLKKMKGVYTFNVTVRDRGPGNMFDTAMVNVTILAAHNAPPEWVIPAFNNATINFLEGNVPDVNVTVVKAIDPDTGVSGVVSYYFYYNGQLVTQTPEFEINSITGRITARIELDREVRESYALVLVARDSGSPALESTRYIVIKVQDKNDEGPEFPSDKNCCPIPYTFFIEENSVPGVVGSVKAVDADSLLIYRRFTYEIVSGNDDGFFTINSDGVIVTNATFDYEKTTSRQLVVEAIPENPPTLKPNASCTRQCLESGNHKSRVIVNVRIIDLDDNSPGFKKKLHNACVSRHAPYRHQITQIRAFDQDPTHALNYSFTDGKMYAIPDKPNPVPVKENVQNLFLIGETDGTVYSNAMMYNYFENYFILIVKVEDSKVSDEAMLRVFVTDPTEELSMIISKPPEEARSEIDELVLWIQNRTDGGIVCYNIMGAKGENNEEWTKIQFHVIEGSSKRVIDGETVRYWLWGEDLGSQQNIYLQSLNARGIKDIQSAASTDWDGFFFAPLLAIMILLLILLFLAFLCLCCWCCFSNFCGKNNIYNAAAAKHYVIPAAHTINPLMFHEKELREEETQELKMNVPGSYYLYENQAFDADDGYGTAKATVKHDISREAALIIPNAAAQKGQIEESTQQTVEEYHMQYEQGQQGADFVDADDVRLETTVEGRGSSFGGSALNGGGTMTTTREESRHYLYGSGTGTITRDTGTGDDMMVADASRGHYIGATLSKSAQDLASYNFDQTSLHGSGYAGSMPPDVGRQQVRYHQEWDQNSHLSSPVFSQSYAGMNYQQSAHHGTFPRSVPITNMHSEHQVSTSTAYMPVGRPPILKVVENETVPVTEQGVFQGDFVVRGHSRPSSRASNWSSGQVISQQAQPIMINNGGPMMYPDGPFIPAQGGESTIRNEYSVSQEYSYQR